MPYRSAVTKTFYSGTATGSGVTSGVSVSNYKELLALVNITSIVGTVTVDYEVSPDDTTYYKHTTAVNAAVAAGSQTASQLGNIGMYGRFRYLVSGGSPSVAMSVKGILKS